MAKIKIKNSVTAAEALCEISPKFPREIIGTHKKKKM